MEGLKKSLKDVINDKERVATNNISLKREIDLLKIKVKEQQEEILELKNKVIATTSKKEKLQNELDTIKNVKVTTKVNSLKEKDSTFVDSFQSESSKKKRSLISKWLQLNRRNH